MSGPGPTGGTRLPTADPDARRRERREQARAAAERRAAREKALAEQVMSFLPQGVVTRREQRGQHTLTVPLSEVKGFLRRCRDEAGYDMLTDLTALDWMAWEGGEHPQRFAVMYTLTNLSQEARLLVLTYVDEDEPKVETVSDLWPAADWAEREVYDMFGLEFTGHGNLIRLLMPFDYVGHPLRKDYPLRGRGERDNFPVIKRANEEAL